VAAGVAGGVGASSATEQSGAQRLLGKPPADWLDPRTGSASVLAQGCGVVSEVTLSVTAQAAFLNVLVLNQSTELLAFDPGATLVQLGAGPKRRVRSKVIGHLEVQPEWQHWLSLELPEKAALEQQSMLTVELLIMGPSFGQCRLRSRLTRPAGPPRAETYTVYNNAEIAFGGGVRALTTGALREVAPGVAFSGAFDFAIYWSMHHGAVFDVTLDFPGRAKARAVDPDRDLSNPTIEAAGFFLGYAGRLPLTGWLSLVYSPQVGVIPFQLTDGTQGAEMTAAIFCPRQRLRLIAPFGRFLGGQVFAAVSASHTYVPYGQLGQVELGGNLFSSVLMLGVGE
jgi:hypothetical protein